MYKDKRVLLIAGGGTLGTYTAKELLHLGCFVDVICPEEKKSDNGKLTFYRSLATEELLENLFSEKHYDGIINFIHYPDIEKYKPWHKMLSENTEHLIFLSSYRVYADEEHPITENSPRLLDVSDDKEFLSTEDYAVPKARAEDFIRNESETNNWTIVRPVISFSDRRLDIVTVSHRDVVECGKKGEVISLPENTKNLTAGLDWAGNSGKLIANLLFKKEALCETFTISTAQNLTWGEIAEIYSELTGARFEWIDTSKWLEGISNPWIAVYDRFFDRVIDNSKVLKVTGLKKEDFVSIKEGIKTELKKIEKEG